jgi:glycosyltransferase involved in cell wall biosynthesis
MKVVVAQKGAREHYLAARALHRRGILARLVTDWYAFGRPSRNQKAESRIRIAKLKTESGNLKLFQRLRGLGRAARAASADEIPDNLVRAMPLRSLRWKWQIHRAARRGCLYESYSATDSAFARNVARLNLPEHDVFFGYSYASLEMLEAEKKRGVFTILDQIDPGSVEFQMVAEEMARYPELAGPPPSFPAKHFDRARREWELADVIVVNSEWTREAIMAEGADASKIEVLPLAFETNAERLKAEKPKNHKADRPLRVLFLGQVNVRKGIRYLLEAARLLENEPVEFTIAGPLGIRKEALADSPINVKWLGPISRDQTSNLYDTSNVFVLPTLSDGFAITQLEAMAHGLPVIVTPNCGRVVEDGDTGFVIPPRDSQALARAIMKFVQSNNFVQAMSARCIRASKVFSVDTYSHGLVEIIDRNLEKQSQV